MFMGSLSGEEKEPRDAAMSFWVFFLSQMSVQLFLVTGILPRFGVWGFVEQDEARVQHPWLGSAQDPEGEGKVNSQGDLLHHPILLLHGIPASPLALGTLGWAKSLG